MPAVLNPFLDFRNVQGKVEESLKTKLKEMYPCSADKWRMLLKEYGIIASSSEEDGHRSGFLRVADPMRGQTFNGRGEFVGTWGGVLYVPDEIAKRILVLGDLP